MSLASVVLLLVASWKMYVNCLFVLDTLFVSLVIRLGYSCFSIPPQQHNLLSVLSAFYHPDLRTQKVEDESHKLNVFIQWMWMYVVIPIGAITYSHYRVIFCTLCVHLTKQQVMLWWSGHGNANRSSNPDFEQVKSTSCSQVIPCLTNIKSILYNLRPANKAAHGNE